MYGIYCIYNNNHLIYIGKTNNFHIRLRNHMASKPWRNEITHIEIAECKNKIDMDIYEKYYINKLNPKYNKAIVYGEAPTFKIQELNFKRFDTKKFIDINKLTDGINSISIYEKRRNKIDEMSKNSIEIIDGEKIDFWGSQNTMYYWYNSLKNEVTFLEVKGVEFLKDRLKDIENGNCEFIDECYKFKFKNRDDIFLNFQEYSSQLKLIYFSISEKRISEGFGGVNLISGVEVNKQTKDVALFIHKSTLDKYFRKYFNY